MKRVNGIIVEATEEELKEVWLMSNWNKTATFDSFKKLMIEEGCEIICGDYQTEDSAPVVRSTTLEEPVTADLLEKEVKPVMDTEKTPPVNNSVKPADTKTVVTTKPSTKKVTITPPPPAMKINKKS